MLTPAAYDRRFPMFARSMRVCTGSVGRDISSLVMVACRRVSVGMSTMFALAGMR